MGVLLGACGATGHAAGCGEGAVGSLGMHTAQVPRTPNGILGGVHVPHAAPQGRGGLPTAIRCGLSLMVGSLGSSGLLRRRYFSE